jgi:hypothetical protein
MRKRTEEPTSACSTMVDYATSKQGQTLGSRQQQQQQQQQSTE